MISLFSGVSWAIEMWVRGWEGLAWIGRLHLTLFLTAILVCAFLNRSSTSQRRSWLTVLGLGLVGGFAGHLYFGLAGYFSFVIGPSALPLIIIGNAGLWLGRLIGIVMFFAVPVIGFALGALMGQQVRVRGILWGCIILISGMVVCPALLDVTSHLGRLDLIHAIKSGFGVPFLVFAFLAPSVIRCPCQHVVKCLDA